MRYLNSARNVLNILLILQIITLWFMKKCKDRAVVPNLQQQSLQLSVLPSRASSNYHGIIVQYLHPNFVEFHVGSNTHKRQTNVHPQCSSSECGVQSSTTMWTHCGDSLENIPRSEKHVLT
jgi:hypothetical protein